MGGTGINPQGTMKLRAWATPKRSECGEGVGGGRGERPEAEVPTRATICPTCAKDSMRNGLRGLPAREVTDALSDPKFQHSCF